MSRHASIFFLYQRSGIRRAAALLNLAEQSCNDRVGI